MRIVTSHKRRVTFRRRRHSADPGLAATLFPAQPRLSAGILFATLTQETSTPELSLESSPHRGTSSWEAATRPPQILLVEDNPGDVRPAREAFYTVDPSIQVYVASDGAAAMAFLRREGGNADAPRPDFILLDLSLPKLQGCEVLAQIKGDVHLRTIPVAILTSSDSEADIARSYELHANCYLNKPAELDGFMSLIESITDFWLTRVTLPQHQD
jgi:two-component system, chemotaxis family, response regulator Rcp1